MRVRLLIMLLCLLSAFAAALAQNKSDALVRLGVPLPEAGDLVLDALQSGITYNDHAYQTFKAMIANDRALVVRSGLAWVKEYTAGPEFSAKYAAYRMERKPKPPETVPTVQDYFASQRKDMEASVAESRKALAGANAETKKTLEASFKQMMDQIAAMEKDPGQREMIVQMLQVQKAENQSRYEESLAEWTRVYPENLKLVIAGRIREFLEMSSDVDFSAKLVQQDGVMRFANQEYEAKSAEWKLCFRAGKEAVTAARTFMQVWLGELESK